MRIIKIATAIAAIALFSLSSCNTTNGLQKRMKNKSKKKCDCPGWSMEEVEENRSIIS
jgi:predicted small secreted protein